MEFLRHWHAFPVIWIFKNDMLIRCMSMFTRTYILSYISFVIKHNCQHKLLNRVTPTNSCASNKSSNNYYFSSATFLSQLSINAWTDLSSSSFLIDFSSLFPFLTPSNVIIWTPGRKRMSHKERRNDDPKHRSGIFCYQESILLH